LRPLVTLFGPTLAAGFGPLSLETVRQEMIRLRWKRKGINRRVQRICRAFRWAVSREILSESVYVRLETLEPLTAGRSAAIEGRPVQAVPLPLVEAIRPHVSRQVWGLIQLQLLTGARPGELAAMRVGDLNTTGKIWEDVPRRHKAQHRGKHRVISIGPRGQALLKEFLTANLDSFVFSPIDAEAERNAARRERRQSPLTPSQAARQATPDGRRRPRAHYTVASYRRAIERRCEIAF
jgi:integrase